MQRAGRIILSNINFGFIESASPRKGRGSIFVALSQDLFAVM